MRTVGPNSVSLCMYRGTEISRSAQRESEAITRVLVNIGKFGQRQKIKEIPESTRDRSRQAGNTSVIILGGPIKKDGT